MEGSIASRVAGSSLSNREVFGGEQCYFIVL